MRKILIMMTLFSGMSFSVSGADMKQANGDCPDVVEVGRGVACPPGETQSGNKCISTASGTEVDTSGQVLKK